MTWILSDSFNQLPAGASFFFEDSLVVFSVNAWALASIRPVAGISTRINSFNPVVEIFFSFGDCIRSSSEDSLIGSSVDIVIYS